MYFQWNERRFVWESDTNCTHLSNTFLSLKESNVNVFSIDNNTYILYSYHTHFKCNAIVAIKLSLSMRYCNTLGKLLHEYEYCTYCRDCVAFSLLANRMTRPWWLSLEKQDFGLYIVNHSHFENIPHTQFIPHFTWQLKPLKWRQISAVWLSYSRDYN